MSAETKTDDGIFPTTWTKCADSGWWRARFPTIQSGVVIRYRREFNDNHDEVSASRDGVCVSVDGPIRDREVSRLATVLSRAQTDYMQLRKQS